MERAWEKNEFGFLGPKDPAFDYGSFVNASLARGVDINARDQRGRTALMHAAASGHSHLIWALLRNGARIDLIDADGRSAGQIQRLLGGPAAASELPYVEDFLTYHGIYIGEAVWDLFWKRDLATLSALFKSGVPVDVFDLSLGRSLLTVAAGNNDLELMGFLLSHGANPNFGDRMVGKNNYPVLSAAKNGHKEAVELLIRHGGLIDSRGYSLYDVNPAYQAAWDGNAEMLDWLLSQGANPEANTENLPSHVRTSIAKMVKKHFWDDSRQRDTREAVLAVLEKHGIPAN